VHAAELLAGHTRAPCTHNPVQTLADACNPPSNIGSRCATCGQSTASARGLPGRELRAQAWPHLLLLVLQAVPRADLDNAHVRWQLHAQPSLQERTARISEALQQTLRAEAPSRTLRAPKWLHAHHGGAVCDSRACAERQGRADGEGRRCKAQAHAAPPKELRQHWLTRCASLPRCLCKVDTECVIYKGATASARRHHMQVKRYCSLCNTQGTGTQALTLARTCKHLPTSQTCPGWGLLSTLTFQLDASHRCAQARKYTLSSSGIAAAHKVLCAHSPSFVKRPYYLLPLPGVMAAQTSADLHITVDSDDQLEAQLAETGLKGAIIAVAEGPGGQ